MDELLTKKTAKVIQSFHAAIDRCLEQLRVIVDVCLRRGPLLCGVCRALVKSFKDQKGEHLLLELKACLPRLWLKLQHVRVRHNIQRNVLHKVAPILRKNTVLKGTHQRLEEVFSHLKVL